jgi:hypothetical protein
VKLKKIVGGEGCVLYEFLDLVDDRENLRGSAIAGGWFLLYKNLLIVNIVGVKKLLTLKFEK